MTDKSLSSWNILKEGQTINKDFLIVVDAMMEIPG